jgi:hypothetical protein
VAALVEDVEDAQLDIVEERLLIEKKLPRSDRDSQRIFRAQPHIWKIERSP